MKKFFFAVAMLGVSTLMFANEEPVVMSTDGTYTISYDANGNAIGMAAPEHELSQSGLFGRRSETSLRESAVRELREMRASIRRTLHFNSMVKDESVVSALSDEMSQSANRAGKTVRQAGANLDRNINAQEAALSEDGGVIVVTPETLQKAFEAAVAKASTEAGAEPTVGGPARTQGGKDVLDNLGVDTWENLVKHYGTDNGDGTYSLTYEQLQTMWAEQIEHSGALPPGVILKDLADEFGLVDSDGNDNGTTATIPVGGGHGGARCPVGEPIVLGLMAAGYAALRRRKNEE